METFIFYIRQGFFHVLDKNALDHVLFFITLTVVFSFRNWKKALLLITFFTVGHSLTFGLSAYDYISADVDLVEFLIPITILIPLVLNIYTSVKEKEIQHNNLNIYFAFFFGLIHGLGFSNYFKMLLDDGDNKLIPLLEFALGIEFAQIAVVLSVLVLGHFFQYTVKLKKELWIIIVSVLVILYIIPMLVERFPN